MSLKPHGWTVVVLAHWNTAILSPAGIKERLFALGESDQIDIQVPLDGVLPYRVKHPDDNIIAAAGEKRLLIEASEPNYETLGKAARIAKNALESLPVTPAWAAGINVNFKASTADVSRCFGEVLDNALSDGGREIVSRTAFRSLKYREGVVNLRIVSEPDNARVLLNFHRLSRSHDELKSWLGTPVADIEKETKAICDILKLEFEESDDDGNDD